MKSTTDQEVTMYALPGTGVQLVGAPRPEGIGVKAMPVSVHAVFATDGDGNTYRVSDPLSWSAAQNEWTKLDDQRRDGLLPQARFFEVRQVTLGPDRPLVGPEVRSHDRYDGAPLNMMMTKPVAGGRGFASAEAAAVRAWKTHFGETYTDRRGYERTQGTGGWYYWPNGRTVAQGRYHLAEVCKRKCLMVQGVNGRWYPLAVETL